MLNLMQRCRFASLKELYVETMNTRSLQYNQQQVAIVPICSNRSSICKDLIIISSIRTPPGRDMPQLSKQNRPHLSNPTVLLRIKQKRQDSSHHSSEEIFPPPSAYNPFEEFTCTEAVVVAKASFRICFTTTCRQWKKKDSIFMSSWEEYTHSFLSFNVKKRDTIPQ